MHNSIFKLFLTIFIVLGSAAGPMAAMSPILVDAPPQVVSGQAFPVHFHVSGPPPSNGTLASLTVYVQPGQAIRLGGTIQAPLTDGAGVFPAVVLSGPSGTVRLDVEMAGASGISETVQVAVAPRLTSGGIGIDMVLQNGRPVVAKPLDGYPAAQAGLRAGDQILAIDGVSTEGSTEETMGKGMAGTVGTPVVLTVLHSGTREPQQVTLVRVSLESAGLRFDTIPNQDNDGLFQIRVHVMDSAGQPISNANVSVHLNPAYAKVHMWLFTGSVYLKDGTGTVAEAVSGTTDADGTAAIWVRLVCNATPYKAVLTATVESNQQSSGTVDSNVFSSSNPSE